MERPMLDGIGDGAIKGAKIMIGTAILIASLAGIVAGGGLVLGIKSGDRASKHDAAIAQADADEAQAIASAAPATVEASAVLVAEVQAEDVTDADTRQAVATADAPTVAVLAAVQPDAAPSTVALASYLGCVAGSQGKGEGSSAYGCVQRGLVLDEAVRAMVEAEAEARKADEQEPAP